MIPSHLRRILLSSLKWIGSGALLIYALHEINSDTVIDMATRQPPLVAIAVISLMIVQMLISTSRWQRILFLLSGSTHKPPYARLTNLNFVSVFFNSCLPGTIGGDVVRAMLLKSDHLPLTTCFHSVIIDRLLAVIGIVVMVIASLPWLGTLIPSLPVGGLIAASIAAAIAGFALLGKLPSWLAPHANRHGIRHALHILESFRRIAFSPRDFILLTLQAALAHGCFCLGIYILGMNLDAGLTVIDSLVLVPPVLLLMMLPISVGGWGMREVSMVAFLGLAGVPKEIALVISVQMGVLATIASLPGAWCYVRRPQA